MKRIYLLFFSSVFTVFCISYLNTATAQIITTIAGTGMAGTSGDGGPGTAAKLFRPTSVAIDGSGNIYIAAEHNIRKVNPSGIISTVAGNGTAGYGGDGGPATAASLNNPMGLAFDAAGNLFFADRFNNRVRKISTTGVISTFIGDGSYTVSGDGGPATAATCGWPAAVAIDAAGNFFIVDEGGERIRKVNTSGIIQTIAGFGSMGGGGYSGDGGPATAAQMDAPVGIAVDGSGNVYISDYYNNRIRKINTSDTMSTFAGTGTCGSLGDGGPASAAELCHTWEVCLDAAGNLYIADQDNNKIRKVNTSGVISTIAGTGVAGHSGDGGLPTAAKLSKPCGVVADAAGNIYIADHLNHVVRKISVPGTSSDITPGRATGYELIPNPNNGSFNIAGSLGTTSDDNLEIVIMNMLSQTVCKHVTEIIGGSINCDISLPDHLPNGLYVVNLCSGNENKVLRFVLYR